MGRQPHFLIFCAQKVKHYVHCHLYQHVLSLKGHIILPIPVHAVDIVLIILLFVSSDPGGLGVDSKNIYTEMFLLMMSVLCASRRERSNQWLITISPLHVFYPLNIMVKYTPVFSPHHKHFMESSFLCNQLKNTKVGHTLDSPKGQFRPYFDNSRHLLMTQMSVTENEGRYLEKLICNAGFLSIAFVAIL